jgi:hypothetical protein
MTSREAAVTAPPVPFAEMWSGFFEYLECQNRAILSCMEPISDPRMLRKRWLEITTRAIDEYLRSPAFLKVMELNLRAVANAKALQNELIGNWARYLGVPLASDVHELADRLRRTEMTLLAHLKGIEARLANIEHKLNGTDGSPHQQEP